MYQNRRKEERNQSKRTNENRRKVNFVSEQVNENEKKTEDKLFAYSFFRTFLSAKFFICFYLKRILRAIRTQLDGNVTVAFAHSAIKCNTADTQNRGRTSNTATTHDEDEAERNMQESIKLGRYQDTVRTPIVAQVNLHYFFSVINIAFL